MTDLSEKTAELLALRDGATPGKWDNSGGHRSATEFGVYDKSGRSICSTGVYQDGKEKTFSQNVANARLIAALPDMLDHIEALAAENKRLRGALEELAGCDWVISLPDRMDAVRDIARAALSGDIA